MSVVRDGSFLGVVAEGEYQALCALRKLMALARWRETDGLPAMHDMPAFLRAQPLETTLVAEKKTEAQS